MKREDKRREIEKRPKVQDKTEREERLKKRPKVQDKTEREERPKGRVCIRIYMCVCVLKRREENRKYSEPL